MIVLVRGRTQPRNVSGTDFHSFPASPASRDTESTLQVVLEGRADHNRRGPEAPLAALPARAFGLEWGMCGGLVKGAGLRAKLEGGAWPLGGYDVTLWGGALRAEVEEWAGLRELGEV